MKFLNFSIFSIPSGSAILSDLVLWNSSLLGKIIPYPLGTDIKALHRDPYQWNATTPFSAVYFDKTDETLSFSKTLGVTNCILPLSSFSSQDGISCAPTTPNFGFYFNSSEFKLLLPTIKLFLEEQAITMGKPDAQMQIQPARIDFIYPTESNRRALITEHELGFNAGSRITTTGIEFSTSPAVSANPILIPFKDKMNEMRIEKVLRTETVKDFSFFGLREVYYTATEYWLNQIELNMGETLNKGLFTIDDKFVLADDNTFHDIGMLKANIIGYQRFTTGSGIVETKFKGHELSFMSQAQMEKIKIIVDCTDNISTFFNFTCEYVDSTGSTVSFPKNTEQNLYSLLSYGITHENPTKNFFNIRVQGKSYREVFANSLKFVYCFSVRRNGEDVTLKIYVNCLNYSQIKFVSYPKTFSTYTCNFVTFFRSIKEGYEGANDAKVIHFLSLFNKTGEAVDASFQKEDAPLTAGLISSDKVYFEIGNKRYTVFEEKKTNTIPLAYAHYFNSWFSPFSNIYLPQNLISCTFAWGRDHPSLSKLVIPYTSMEKRGSIEALFPANCFNKFRNLTEGLMIFNISHFVPAETINPDYASDLTVTFSAQNWQPSTGSFGGMGTTGQTIPVFLSSDYLFESRIPDYSSLLSNAAQGSLATIKYLRWQPSSVEDYYEAQFFIRLMRGSTVLNQISTSIYERYWMALDDTTVFSAQTINEESQNELRGGTIKELLEESGYYSIAYTAPVEVFPNIFRYTIEISLNSWSHHIISP